MDLSIIVPFKDRFEELSVTVKSIVNADFEGISWELILVNDGGEVLPASLHTELLTDANNIAIVNLDVNSGACVARNEGVKVAKGRIISFVDSDDLILPNRYQSQLNLHDKLDCVSFCDVIFMNKNGLSKHKNKAYCGEDVVDYLFSGGLMQTSTLMLPRKLALAYPFKTGLRKHQDYDFVIRLFRNGVRFNHIQEYLVMWNNKSTQRMAYDYKLEDSEKWFNSVIGYDKGNKYNSHFATNELVPQIYRSRFSLGAVTELSRIHRKYSLSIKSFPKILLKWAYFNLFR